MLPRSLYELLPYAYLVAGLASGLLIDSSLILIASMLLISAGVLILYLRYQYRQDLQLPVAGDERRSGQDRRQALEASFPLVDFAGNMVESDRRCGDRRSSLEAGIA